MISKIIPLIFVLSTLTIHSAADILCVTCKYDPGNPEVTNDTKVSTPQAMRLSCFETKKLDDTIFCIVGQTRALKHFKEDCETSLRGNITESVEKTYSKAREVCQI